MTKDELNLAAMRAMVSDDSFISMFTRFGGGRQVLVKDVNDRKVLIQVDEEGRVVDRVPITGAHESNIRGDSIMDSARRGEVLFDPRKYRAK